MRNLLLILLNSLFCTFAFANDLSSGAGEFYTGGPDTKEYVAEDGNCPTLLKKWVDDDFTDQSSFFFPFPSEAKTCQTAVRGYQDYLKSAKKNPDLAGSTSLGGHLSQKFKDQVHPSYQDRFLKDCKTLPPEKATAIQTRFYAASSRIAAVNAPIIDEVSYYDSLLPSAPGILHGLDCTPMFPDNNKKCSEFKTQAQSCAVNKQKRFDDMVARTKKNLTIIEDLTRAHKNCVKEITGLSGRAYTAEEKAGVKTCDAFLQVIELKKNETPWIRGEIFGKLAIKEKPNPRNKFVTQYDFENKSIEKAMNEQISANRKALTDTYNSNLENFRCLSGSMTSNGKPCDFKKIRTDISTLPPLDRNDFGTKDQKDREATTYLEAEKCLLERGEDRAKTQEIISSSGKGVVFTILTAGLGGIASGGVRAINAASKVGRAASIGSGLLGAALTTEDLKHTYDKCSIETKMVHSFSGKSEVTAENICSDPKSQLAQAREKESDCLVSALLSAPGLLPYAAAVPSLARMARAARGPAAEKAELNAFISNMSGRDNIRKQDLDFAGSLNKEDRLTAAEGILGRSLSQKEQDAIIAAHEKGGPFSYNGAYAPEEIAEKRAILKAAGFSERESETMLWKGITGYGRAEIVTDAQTRAKSFFGKDITRAQAEAIVKDHDLMIGRYTKEGDQVQNLTEAGFTPTQMKEIMGGKLHDKNAISSTNPTQAKAVPPPSQPPLAKPGLPKSEPQQPVPVAQPAPVPQVSQQQLEAAAVKKVIGQDKLYDISLDQKATPKQIEAAIDEQLRRNGYKPHEYSNARAGYIIDTFNSDVEHIYKLKSRLDSAKPGSSEAANLQQSILAYQARCKSWKTLYIGATYSHDGYIRNFNRQIELVCSN